jgi:hypothetical protein
MRKAIMIAGACVLALGGCAVSPAPHGGMSPTAVRTAWLSKGRYVWQPLVPATQPVVVRRVKLEKRDTTTTIATVPRVLACDLTGFNAGCATY